jgi:Protein of unknown function (DUF3089)
MKKLWILVSTVIVVSLLWACVDTTDTAPADYSVGQHWLCLPDRQDACNSDLSTTVVANDGSLTLEAWRDNPESDIDCFYVYPTVSKDLSRVSDFYTGEEERAVIQAQAARFGSKCRVFAPAYRQVTIAGLQAHLLAGTQLDMSLGYRDVLTAWQYYLQHHNRGRGVVLIGHSQGAHILTRLVQEEIEGQAIMSRLVSALLIGWRIEVPENNNTGVTFKQLQPCETGNQTGCYIAYSAYRNTLPPIKGSLFGFAQQGNESVCVSPSQLLGKGDRLHSYLLNQAVVSDRDGLSWVKGEEQPQTPFVSVPGLVSAQCVTREGATYLEVSIHADAEDLRTDDIAGDVVIAGKLQRRWGLHLIDMELTMGDLLNLIERQTKAYREKKLHAGASLPI